MYDRNKYHSNALHYVVAMLYTVNVLIHFFLWSILFSCRVLLVRVIHFFIHILHLYVLVYLPYECVMCILGAIVRLLHRI